jgi:predicted GNAT family acetyltransferase
VLGAAPAARAAERVLGFQGDVFQLNRDEPHFSMPLSDLQIPDTRGLRLAPATEALRETLLEWRHAYDLEAFGQADPERVVQSVDGFIAKDSHRVLMHGDTPVALTGFNARTDTCVQVGGVYTPPALRRQGFARTAVALHLAEARAAGVRDATLFAASAGAARVYEGLGFQRIGDYALILLADPQECAA